MAGKFLTLEEVAKQLGVEPDEVNRLVDRKKLFPMRDGASMKFKSDDVQRYVDSKGESSDLSLDLDEPVAAIGGSEIDLGDAIAIDGGSIFDEGGAKGVSATVLRGPPDGGESELDFGSALAAPDGPAIAGKSSVVTGSGVATGDSLGLGSIAMGSSPSGSLATGSVTGEPGGTEQISDVARVTGIADQSGLSIAGESGLSLEDGDVELSGIQISGVDITGIGGSAVEVSGVDLGTVGGESVAPEGGTMLGGDTFELGGSPGDDESASVVIATDSESSDSSFFTNAIGGESGSDEPVSSSRSSVLDLQSEPFVGSSFSALQICGLACCAVLLLVGGFICYDVVLSIGSVRGAPFATPILESLTQVFGLK